MLVLLPLCASLVSTNSFIKLPVQERTKTLKEHLAHVKAEVHSQNAAHSLRRSVRDSPPYHVTVGNRSTNFFCNISIGTPPQNFTVLLRTDITAVWVPSSLCPVDRFDMCRNHRQYNRTLSKTYRRNGQRFGDNGMYCELSYDTVSLGGASVVNQSFAEAFQYIYNDTGIPYDGLFGLGLRQRIFSNDSSIFVNMIQQNVIDSIVFGIYYRKNSTDPNDSGGLIIGGRNESVYKKNLVYVNCTSQYLWQFTVDLVFLNTTDKQTLKLCPHGCTGYPGIGSHFISASRKDLDKLHHYLGAVYSADDHTYLFNCSALEDIQPVYICIGKNPFKLPWQSFVDKVAGPTTHEICISSFVAYDDNTTSGAWTFGDAFFTSVYVEFDADKGRMGFGQSRFVV